MTTKATRDVLDLASRPVTNADLRGGRINNMPIGVATPDVGYFTNLHAQTLTVDGGFGDTARNLGSGIGVFSRKVGIDLQFKTLVAGAGITLTPRRTQILIAATGGGSGGEANTARNIGTGIGLFSVKSGVNLSFKRLLGGSGVTLQDNGNTVTISAATGVGEANTVRNIGSGTGWFSRKTGVNFAFKRIVAGNGITLRDNGSSITVSASASSGAVLSKQFDRGAQSWATPRSHSYSHGLGAAPKVVTVRIINVTAEGGFTPGEEVLLNPASNSRDSNSGDNNGAITVVITSSSISLFVAASGIRIGDKSGSYLKPTPSSWRMRIRAFA